MNKTRQVVEEVIRKTGAVHNPAEIAQGLGLRQQVLAHTVAKRLDEAGQRWREVTEEDLAKFVVEAMPNALVPDDGEDEVTLRRRSRPIVIFGPGNPRRFGGGDWVPLRPDHLRMRTYDLWPERGRLDEAGDEDDPEIRPSVSMYRRPLPIGGLLAVKEALAVGCFDEIHVEVPRLRHARVTDPFVVGVIRDGDKEHLFLLYRWDTQRMEHGLQT